MMVHPRAYWTFPETERRKRLVFLGLGLAIGLVAGVMFGAWWAMKLLWL